LFIIGAAKAATTKLWKVLNEHPDIFLPAMKETNFLLGGEWSRGGLEWYESLYEPAGDAIYRGDASPSYSMFPIFLGPPESAASLAPHARIIYAIRHPVERMVSHWAEATTSGYEHRDLEQATTWNSIYYLTSCYGLQLSRWAAVFPRDSLLLVRSEDLAHDPGPTIDSILTHLGLPPAWRPSDPAAHVNPSDGKLRTRDQLRLVSGALRGAGFEQAAVRVAQRTPRKERAHLLTSYAPPELTLSPERVAAWLDCFRPDFALLRQFVGDETDLYGLA
jgi:hypothetical protein